MNSKGQIVDADGKIMSLAQIKRYEEERQEVLEAPVMEELSEEDHRQMSATIKRQIVNPTAVSKRHIKRSDIWNAQQLIRKIQRQLVEGYTFDKDHLTALVNTMFGFINGIVDPDSIAQGAEVKVDGIEN